MEQLNFNENLLSDCTPPIVNANEPHMACLFLLDTSNSMNGQLEGVIPIDELNKAINRFKDEVCCDEKTRAILDVAIVEFNSNVNVIQDFSPVEFMQTVNLTAQGGTYLSPALETAIGMVNERSRFYRQMGTQPYKPWIVVITDGEPLDNIDDVAHLASEMSKNERIAVWSMLLPGANEKTMAKISGLRTAHLVDYNFSGFFDWVNKSMRAVSESSPGEKVRLPEDNNGSFTLADLG